MPPQSPAPPGDPPGEATRHPTDDTPAQANKKSKPNNTAKDTDQAMFQEPAAASGETERSGTTVKLDLGKMTTPGAWRALVETLQKENARLKADKSNMEKVVESLTATVEKLQHQLSKHEGLYEKMESFESRMESRMRALEKGSGAVQNAAATQSVQKSPSNTAAHGAPARNDAEFPLLSSSAKAPSKVVKTSFAAVASRAPLEKPIEKTEYDHFHARPISRIPVKNLPNDGSDLLPEVTCVYLDNVDRKPITFYKKLFLQRGIPPSQILSMDFVQTRRHGEEKVVLEIMCFVSNVALLKKTLINRWGVEILNNYDPSKPWNPDASPEIKKLVLDRYRNRMLKHANRLEDTYLARRRLFGQLFVKAGGKEEELDKILTAEEIAAAEQARVREEDFEEGEEETANGAAMDGVENANAASTSTQ